MQTSWSHRSKFLLVPNSPPPPLRLEHPITFSSHPCSVVACAHYYWSMHPLPPRVMHVHHPSFNFQLVTCAYKTKIKRSDGPSFHSPLHKHPAYVTRPKFYNSLGSIRCLGRSASKRESMVSCLLDTMVQARIAIVNL